MWSRCRKLIAWPRAAGLAWVFAPLGAPGGTATGAGGRGMGFWRFAPGVPIAEWRNECKRADQVTTPTQRVNPPRKATPLHPSPARGYKRGRRAVPVLSKYKAARLSCLNASNSIVAYCVSVYSCAHCLTEYHCKLVRHPVRGEIIHFGFSGRIVEVFTRRPENVAEKRTVVPALTREITQKYFSIVSMNSWKSFMVLNSRKVAPSFSNFKKCAICRASAFLEQAPL